MKNLKTYESFETEEEWEEENDDDIFLESPSPYFVAKNGTKVIIKDDSRFYYQGVGQKDDKDIKYIGIITDNFYDKQSDHWYHVDWYLDDVFIKGNGYQNKDLLFNDISK